MKKYLYKLSLTAFIFAVSTGAHLFSQCTSATFGQYPSGTFTPTNCIGSQTITTCAFASEYSMVNLTGGLTYTFSTSVATDYITIADNATNTAIVFGTGPLNFTCPVSGLYRFYRHLPGCGTQGTCRNAYIFSGTTPTNNACINAIPIDVGSTNGTTSCSSTDVAPICGTAADAAAGGVWYSFTSLCSGNYTASLCTGTSFNTQLRIFSGTCGALVCEGGNNDFCSTQSEVTWAGTGGTTYYILVHGAGTAAGTFSLNLSQTDAVAPVPDVASLSPINSTCAVTLTAPTATDNCAGSITGTTPIMNFTSNGTYNITWTYDDGNGNTANQPQSITINDATAPTIGCISDTTLGSQQGMCGATVNYQTPACPFSGILYNQSVDPFPLDNGYFITSSFPDYIADDFVIPGGTCWNISNFSANIWTQGMGMTSLVVNIHDNAGGIPGAIISTQTLTSANWTSTFVGTVGAYTIRDYDFTLITPVNLCGGTYWLSIYDNVAPYNNVAWSIGNPITGYPGQQSVYGTPTGPWTSNGNDFVFNLGGSIAGTVTDNCPQCPGVTQTTGLPSGSVFPVGTTTNTFVATDNGGNTSTCSFDVTVMDTEAPVPDMVQTFTFPSGPINVAIADYSTVMDSILISGLSNNLSSGNIGSVCIDITHTYDGDLDISLISPLGTVYNLSDDNGSFYENYTNTCFDMSASTNITAGFAPFTGSFIPEGAGGFDVFNGEDPNGYWKLAIYDDAGGDIGNLTSFSMSFAYVDMLPTVNAVCSVTVTAPTGTDNCDGPVTATSTDPLTYTVDGVYNVQWTYTDIAGNSFMQTQTVIVEDSIAPVPDVADLLVVTDVCTVTVSTTPTATDNCEGAITATTTDPTIYNTAGTYTITWTYDDGRGNTSTQTQTIVVTDNTSPVPDQFILPNVIGNCTVTVDDIPTATDNCVGTITATTTDPISYNLIGTFFIIWHFDDGNGNTWTQNQTVVVNPCLGLEDESGQWNALIYPNPSSGIFTLSLSEMPTENTQVRLVDALGQVLYSEILQGQIQQFDFSHLASSTYYLLVTSDHGQISKPIIIRQNY